MKKSASMLLLSLFFTGCNSVSPKSISFSSVKPVMPDQVEGEVDRYFSAAGLTCVLKEGASHPLCWNPSSGQFE